VEAEKNWRATFLPTKRQTVASVREVVVEIREEGKVGLYSEWN